MPDGTSSVTSPACTQSPSGAITPSLSDRLVPTTDGQSVAWIVDRNFASYLDVAPFGSADAPSREIALTSRSYSVYQMEMAHGRRVMADLDNAYLVDLASGGVRTAAVKLWASLGDGAYPLRDSALFIDNGEIREVRF